MLIYQEIRDCGFDVAKSGLIKPIVDKETPSHSLTELTEPLKRHENFVFIILLPLLVARYTLSIWSNASPKHHRRISLMTNILTDFTIN